MFTLAPALGSLTATGFFRTFSRAFSMRWPLETPYSIHGQRVCLYKPQVSHNAIRVHVEGLLLLQYSCANGSLDPLILSRPCISVCHASQLRSVKVTYLSLL